MNKSGILIATLLLMPATSLACDEGRYRDTRPDDFVALSDIASDIPVVAVYADSENFLGEAVDGYDNPACLLTLPAALALKQAQDQLAGSGLSLLVFDCYRPQQAVDHFMEWAAEGESDDDDDDISAEKKKYFPNLSREDLVDDVYVAECSGHSRGSTVDLTMVYRPGADREFDASHLLGCDASFDGEPKGINMGTGFDCFDSASHTEQEDMPFFVLENRRMLKGLMERAGFTNYANEWWHYKLVDEPYPDTRFGFDVE